MKDDLETLKELVRLAGGDPAEAIALAQPHLASDSQTARNYAQLTIGIAQRNLGDAAASRHSLNEALHSMPDHSDLRDQVEVSLAATEAFSGDFETAIGRLDTVLGTASGNTYARAAHQRATLLQRSGDSVGARAGYEESLKAFVSQGDDLGQGHLHTNLGILLTYEGAISAAIEEFEAAFQAYSRVGQSHWMALTIHNKGWAVSCEGNLPAALSLYDEAERQFREMGNPTGVRVTARAETLMKAGLYSQALRALDDGAAELAELGLEADRAEALVLASRAARHSGDLTRSVQLADQAQALLGSQGRTGWSALALAEKIESDGKLITDLATTAADLSDAGHRAAVVRLVLAQAEAGLTDDNTDHVKASLELLPGIPLTPEEQFRLDGIEAKLASASGDSDRALQICSLSLDRAHRFAETTGSLELLGSQTGPVHSVVDLAKAITIKNPASYHYWSDQLRSPTTTFWPRSDDANTKSLLASYRAAEQDVRESPDDLDSRTKLQDIRAALEEQSWRDKPRKQPSPSATQTDRLCEVSISGRHLVISSSSPDPRHRVIPHDAGLFVALDRAFRLWMANPQAESAAATRCQDLATEADHLLFDGESVRVDTIVLDSELRHLPVGLLPSLSAGPLQVALAREGRAAPRELDRLGNVLVIDTSLTAVDPMAEVANQASWQVASDSTDAVLDLLEHAALVHFRGHGGSEPENPMFSWLGVGQERLYLYDLTGVVQAPPGVVVANCLGSRAAQFGAAGAVSFAEGFLGTGAQWVVASATVVADDPSVSTLLRDFHTQLADGQSPQHALHLAKQTALAVGATAAAAAFNCYRSSARSTA